MNQGKMIIFSAPSGAGKTTIVKHLMESNLPVEFSISATSRKKRENEVDGKDYYFLEPGEFREKIKQDEFIEWEEVYPETFYGTLKSEIERIWKNGHHVIFDVDVKGGLSLMEKFPGNTLSIFVKPPSVEELKNRLEKRSTDPPEKIKERVAKAAHELKFSTRFDKVLINDDLNQALKEAKSTVQRFIND
jgi:guanylate kinase